MKERGKEVSRRQIFLWGYVFSCVSDVREKKQESYKTTNLIWIHSSKIGAKEGVCIVE
jgi:hypothetical protein